MEYISKCWDAIRMRHRTRGAKGLSEVFKCTPEELGLQEQFRVRVSQDITDRQETDQYQRLIVPGFKPHLGDEVSVVRQANDTHYLGFNKNGWGYFETKYAEK
jgi:hypothetical protein